MATTNEKNIDVKDSLEQKKFAKRVWSLVMRYQSCGVEGMQRAMPENCFKVMKDYFGVDIEMCASALNNTYHIYYSAHMDVEHWFGSKGSVFDSDLSNGGAAQVNPPFDVSVDLALMKILEIQMDKAETNNVPLTFILVYPFNNILLRWSESCSYLRSTFALQKNQHAYRNGLEAFQKDGPLRKQNNVTSIIVLQTSAAYQPTLKSPKSKGHFIQALSAAFNA